MSAIVVAKFENKRDAEYVAGLIRKLRREARVISARDWEDVYLAEMIQEGMKEKGSISEIKFSAWLKRKIKAMR